MTRWVGWEPGGQGRGLFWEGTQSPGPRLTLGWPQVMQVVREQLARTLALKPSSLELFRSKVNALTYGEVLRLRQTERLHQEGTLAPPIL